MAALLLTPPEEAVISATPPAKPVATPPVTEATGGFDEVHSKLALTGLPLASLAAAINVCVWPTSMVAVAGVRAMVATSRPLSLPGGCPLPLQAARRSAKRTAVMVIIFMLSSSYSAGVKLQVTAAVPRFSSPIICAKKSP